nr:uncharacterized protein LOC124492975 [Dermatophagoides farinae]
MMMMMIMDTNKFNYSYLLLFAIFCNFQSMVTSYECYVCNNQEDNNGKCIRTVRTCNLDDNSCMTVVRWGSTPYWDPTGQKQYYISKRCTTLAQCQEARENSSRRCDRIWYNDWECVECCTGDRCNYYITLGTSTIHGNMVMIIVSIAAFITIVTYFR